MVAFARGRTLNCALAWILSALIALAGWTGMPEVLGSLVCAAALPWLALAGIPRRGPEAGSPRVAAVTFALAAPVLALAAAVEWQAGGDARDLALELPAALALIAGLSLAGRGTAALPWLVLVLGLPLAAAVLGWNDAPGGAPAWLELVSTASPVTWAFHRAGPGAAPVWTDVLAPTATALLLLGLARRRGR